MTMFGASWGLKLLGVTPLAKLVAIRLGDGCDTDGRGTEDFDDLTEWCGAERAEVIAALASLAFSTDVAWSFLNESQISYSLPHGALPDRRAPRKSFPEGTLQIYVMRASRGVKVGITGDVAQRVSGLRLSMLDDSIELMWHTSAPASFIRRAERGAHTALAAKLIRNEWFSATVDEAISAAKAALEEVTQTPK